MPKEPELSARASEHVARLTGIERPNAVQVARVWVSRGPFRIVGEIEDWLVRHHRGFRLQRDLSNKAQNILHNEIGHRDFGPEDLAAFSEEQMLRWRSCGQRTLDEILGWMKAHGVTPKKPTMPDSLSSTLDNLAIAPGGAYHLRTLIDAAWARMSPKSRMMFIGEVEEEVDSAMSRDGITD